MELDITNNIDNKQNNANNEVDNFIKELEQEVNKQEFKLQNIKIDENSDLSLVNNIAQNNKFTIENKEKLFQEEKSTLFDIYRNDEKAGELYYIASNRANNDFYTFKINEDVRDEPFQILQKSQLPENAKVGEIYRQKDGIFTLNKKETKELEQQIKSVAKKILNNQEKEGGYKKEFTKKDLVEGKGYFD